MLTLETCVSCWQYESLLRYHLSALALYPPEKCRVTCTVHYTAEDKPTVNVLEEFLEIRVPNVVWNFIHLRQPYLMRRAIARNDACLRTSADFILMGDVDYILRGSVLDEASGVLAAECQKSPAIMFPPFVLASREHCDGDAEIERAKRGGVIDIDQSLYSVKEVPRAIGGVQWIPGDAARRIGYLPHSQKFQKPQAVWKQTYEDVEFRRTCGLRHVSVDVKGIYRIRHSRRGRTDIGVRL